jgi:hypothetical protein
LVLSIAPLLVLSVFAFYLTFKAGQRGLFAFDQCIVFDGGYRVVSGQIPYRDFVMPFGPVTFWLQAFFFRLFGVSYFGYLVGAAAVNVLAALCAVFVVRQLVPRSRFLSLVAGTLTAVWFYPPFGTPWVDQTAFFFALLALGAVVWGVISSDAGGWRTFAIAGCGCLAFLSFMSKQNVGAFIFLLYPVLIAVAHAGSWKRLFGRIGLFLGGFAGCAAAFIVWLHVRSDYAVFVQHFFEIPSRLGSKRIGAFAESWLGIARSYFGGRGPLVVSIMVWVSLAVSIWALVRVLSRRRERAIDTPDEASGSAHLSIVICLYLVVFQYLFTNTTLNQPENALGFFGISFALAMGLLMRLTGGRAAGRYRAGLVLRTVMFAGIAAGVVLASVAGVGVAMDRRVHDILRGASYNGPAEVERLEHLRWAEPTRIGGFNISEASIVRLYEYLKQRDENFFVFPDFTIFYGIVGTPSPQPVLWFHRWVTYDPGSNTEIDERIVRDLKRNNVTIFILEQVAWFNTGKRLADFPCTKEYLMNNFARVGQIGIFSIHEKVGDQD